MVELQHILKEGVDFGVLLKELFPRGSEVIDLDEAPLVLLRLLRVLFLFPLVGHLFEHYQDFLGLPIRFLEGMGKHLLTLEWKRHPIHLEYITHRWRYLIYIELYVL
jgi:hypothetical protein